MAAKTEPNQARILATRAGAGAVVLFMLSFLLGLMGYKPFTEVPALFGLRWGALGGVFIDCSQPQNRSLDFCKGGGSQLAKQKDAFQRQFREVDKNALPFSLHD